jgi:hypothetical protein
MINLRYQFRVLHEGHGIPSYARLAALLPCEFVRWQRDRLAFFSLEMKQNRKLVLSNGTLINRRNPRSRTGPPSGPARSFIVLLNDDASDFHLAATIAGEVEVEVSSRLVLKSRLEVEVSQPFRLHSRIYLPRDRSCTFARWALSLSLSLSLWEIKWWQNRTNAR